MSSYLQAYQPTPSAAFAYIDDSDNFIFGGSPADVEDDGQACSFAMYEAKDGPGLLVRNG